MSERSRPYAFDCALTIILPESAARKALELEEGAWKANIPSIPVVPEPLTKTVKLEIWVKLDPA